MVKFDIFKTAFGIYQGGDVLFIGATDKAARFLVDGVRVRMEVTPTGTRFQCECKFHKSHMLQDKLCSRVIAVILFVYFKRGKFKND